MTESEHEGGGYRTAADCVDAGMYWFRACDLGAAEAWWRRALELEPENQRALECLKLLSKTSSTGYKQDSWASMPAVNREAAAPLPAGRARRPLVPPLARRRQLTPRIRSRTDLTRSRTVRPRRARPPSSRSFLR